MKKYKPVSTEAKLSLGKDKKRVIISQGTLDKHDCPCKEIEQKYKEIMGQTKTRPQYLAKREPIQCPLATGKRRFKLLCPKCGEIVAEVHAKSKNLKDWCNLHYVSWFNKNSWYGAYGVNINPYTLRTTFECCCGEKSDLYQLTIK